MNLETCTPGQRASVQHVGGPLLVSAGAGSGKTFTLTQRIAYALLPESGPAVDGIDEVLAITFTEKAAAEIKARVKRTLRAEGLAEQALAVDAAWISTIHGMCARILRTHALDLGLDPAFGIVGDAERADMLAEAVDEAIGADNDIIARGSYAALFDEYKARSSLPGEPSVASLLEALLDKAAAVRGGLDAVATGPGPVRAGELARELLVAYEQVSAALEQAGGSATAERARAQAADAVDALQAFLAGDGGAPDADADSALRALAFAANGCARIGGNFKAAVKEEVKAFQAVYARTAQQIALGLACPRAAELLSLAREVSDRYERKKRAACVLDNDDLLSRTLAAFEDCPEIARRYEQRFKLVMVDEFQDTSQLQIDMISRLAGPACAHLCTVGDAQQSIYRFRGADVNVYEAHKRAMRSEEVGALYVELTRNFRSHGDVLSFVDRVFEQPCSFGGDFMSLEPDPARKSSWKGSVPRIDLALALQPAGRGTGVTTADAKRACARAIAERFAALRADGHAPGDMVVLLGKMTRAGVYAEALRAAGFECVVAGGSQFAAAPEVRVVARLAEALANPANTAALFEVLTSDMLRLSADDLLMLSTGRDEETGRVLRRDLGKGFARLADESGLPSRLAHAVRVVTGAQEALRTQPLSRAVMGALVSSGWMARLERQGAVGLACAGNVLKAHRLLEQLESKQHLGPASAARAFASALAGGLKEAPGALSGKGGDVVRIMTIHASKGLEFPIVAVADFAGASSRSGKLVAETVGGAVLASLAPGRSLERFPNLAKRIADYALDEADPDAAAARDFLAAGGAAQPACSQAAYRAALAERAAAEELAEARRKLYVALTRASEALVVALDAKAPAEGKDPSYPDLVDDIRSALCGPSDFPEGEALLPYGGSEPARFMRVPVQPEGSAAEAGAGGGPCVGDAQAGRDDCFLVPPAAGPACARALWSPLRDGVFSYSSVVPANAGRSRDGAGQDAASVADAADADKATALGSAFHRAAQLAVEAGGAPDADRLAALARSFGLSAEQEGRLGAACARWFASTTFAEACAFPQRRAEVPFLVEVDGGLLEGEIDLLCTQGADAPAAAPALVVDYKTGGADDEPAEALREKHLLQAQCYAYAVLLQGCAEVELRFVRVERPARGAAGFDEPQEVRYRFASDDIDALRRAVSAARANALQR